MAQSTPLEAPEDLSDTPSIPSPERIALRKAYLSQQRLSMHPTARVLAATGIGFTAGGLSGLFQGSKMAGLRFRAENAHRLPTTTTGWYLYHKSKNYHIALGGLKKGLKEGLRIGGMVGFFMLSEDAVDKLRAWYAGGVMKKKDVGSTVVAALGTSALFSVWNRFPLTTAARTAKIALAFGLAYGVGQDALGYAAGRSPSYVEVLKRWGSRPSSQKAQIESKD